MRIKFLAQGNNQSLWLGSNSRLTGIHQLRVRRAIYCATPSLIHIILFIVMYGKKVLKIPLIQHRKAVGRIVGRVKVSWSVMVWLFPRLLYKLGSCTMVLVFVCFCLKKSWGKRVHVDMYTGNYIQRDVSIWRLREKNIRKKPAPVKYTLAWIYNMYNN